MSSVSTLICALKGHDWTPSPKGGGNWWGEVCARCGKQEGFCINGNRWLIDNDASKPGALTAEDFNRFVGSLSEYDPCIVSARMLRHDMDELERLADEAEA